MLQPVWCSIQWLYGDKELNYYEIAAKVQEKLGIPVRYEPIDIPTFAAGLVAAGMSPFRVQNVSSVAQDYLDGVFSGTNDLVEVIGGTKPRTIEDSVAATRSLLETDGVYWITDERLSRA
jgi:NAD(P)H dehydrogenase (quinone)